MLWVRLLELFAVAGFAGLSFLGVHIMQGGKKSAIIVAIVASVSLLILNTVLEGETGKGIALTGYCAVRDCKASKLINSEAASLSDFLDDFDKQNWNSSMSTDLLASTAKLYDKKTIVDLATNGHERAARLAASGFYNGSHGFKVDKLLAQKFHRVCAEEESPPCMHNLGVHYEVAAFEKAPENGNSEEYKLATNWYTKAAAAGQPQSYSVLGKFHYVGMGGLPKNYVAASNSILQAIEKGDVSQAHLVAGIVRFGWDGQPPNVSSSMKYYKMSADFGHRDSQLQMGIYFNKQNNRPEAIKYLRLAAANDSSAAIVILESLGEKVK